MFNFLLDTFNSGIVTLFIVAIFVMTLFKGIVQYGKFSYVLKDIKFYMNIISLYLVYLSYDFIAYELYYLLLKTFNLYQIETNIIGFFFKILLFIIMFLIYAFVCRCIYILIFKNIISECHKLFCKLPMGFKCIIFGLIKVPKAVLNVLILVFVLNTLSVFLKDSSNLVKIINSSTVYKNLSTKIIVPFKYDLNEIILNIFNPIFDTFEDMGAISIKYLYNGVTIDEATMSNDEIEEYAIESVKNIEDTYEKAKKLYNDVINMLDYDNQKSEEIMNENFNSLSGAIFAFETKKGICFDYASLYSVLSEIAELPNRIVVGKGFDGKEWINHAWNEVYIEELDKWIQVDTTFGEIGNYFDVEDFDVDHKKERIIWEFSV